MICPVCQRCPFVNGVCEDRVNRGRRFFLMGALILPVARKLEALAPIVAPPDVAVPRYEIRLYSSVAFDGEAFDVEALGARRWSWALAT